MMKIRSVFVWRPRYRFWRRRPDIIVPVEQLASLPDAEYAGNRRGCDQVEVAVARNRRLSAKMAQRRLY